MAKPTIDQEMLARIRRFVQELSNVVDVQFSEDLGLPKLSINPRDKSQSRVTAHYMLLVASIDQGRLVGRAENARRLLVHCHKQLGENLYSKQNKEAFEETLASFTAHSLGPSKNVIPGILASANRFVAATAGGNLVQWATQFNLPSQIADAISTNVDWMGKTQNSARKKTWMYMRWMVRPHPDLRIWEGVSPKDLFVPVDVNVARAASLLGAIPERSTQPDWSDVVTITDFAKTLFPEDPAKIDYPFFLLGRGDLKARDVASKLGLRLR